MNPVTDVKKVKRVFRIVDIEDKREPFGLLDVTGLLVRQDQDPRRLADYALESGNADEVSHDYDLRAFGERPPRWVAPVRP